MTDTPTDVRYKDRPDARREIRANVLAWQRLKRMGLEPSIYAAERGNSQSGKAV